MSNIRTVTESFSVSEQVHPDHLDNIAKLGFKTIIVNRPDYEGEGQPHFDIIEQAAAKVGLKAVYIPVVHGQPTDSAAIEMKAALDDMPKPILAYCRSGGRSMALWTQAIKS